MTWEYKEGSSLGSGERNEVIESQVADITVASQTRKVTILGNGVFAQLRECYSGNDYKGLTERLRSLFHTFQTDHLRFDAAFVEEEIPALFADLITNQPPLRGLILGIITGACGLIEQDYIKKLVHGGIVPAILAIKEDPESESYVYQTLARLMPLDISVRNAIVPGIDFSFIWQKVFDNVPPIQDIYCELLINTCTFQVPRDIVGQFVPALARYLETNGFNNRFMYEMLSVLVGDSFTSHEGYQDLLRETGIAGFLVTWAIEMVNNFTVFNISDTSRVLDVIMYIMQDPVDASLLPLADIQNWTTHPKLEVRVYALHIIANIVMSMPETVGDMETSGFVDHVLNLAATTKTADVEMYSKGADFNKTQLAAVSALTMFLLKGSNDTVLKLAEKDVMGMMVDIMSMRDNIESDIPLMLDAFARMFVVVSTCVGETEAMEMIKTAGMDDDFLDEMSELAEDEVCALREHIQPRSEIPE